MQGITGCLYKWCALIPALLAMSYSIASTNVIWQQNTETNLDSLVTLLAGKSLVSGTGTAKKTFLNLEANQIQVYGDMDFDASSYECLSHHKNTIQVKDGGVLNLFSNNVFNSTTIRQPVIGIRQTLPEVDWWGNPDPAETSPNSGVITVEKGGKINWHGAGVMSVNGFNFTAGSIIDIKDAFFWCQNDAASGARQFISFINASNVTINGFTMVGGELINRSSSTNITKVSRSQAAIGIFPNRLVASLVDNQYFGVGNTVDVTVQTEGIASPANTRVKNSNKGSATIILGSEILADNRNYGRVETYREVDFDLSGTIQKARYFNRSKNLTNVRKNKNGFNDTADKILSGTVLSTGKIASTIEVILGIVNVSSGSHPRGTFNTGIHTIDILGDSATPGTDLRTFYVWSYGHLVSALQANLAGNNKYTYKSTLVPDTSIRASYAIASAYTNVDANATYNSSEKAYDAFNVLKVKNDAEMELPAIDKLYVSRAGVELNALARNVVVTKTGSSAVYVTSADVYLKVSTKYTGNLKTTAHVTLEATLEGDVSANRVIAGTHRVTGAVVGDYEVTLPFSATNQTIDTLKITAGTGDVVLTNCVVNRVESTLTGNVDVYFDQSSVVPLIGSVTRKYVKAQVTAIAGAAVGAWLKSQGDKNRAGIITATCNALGVAELDLDVNEEYYVIADAVSYNRSGLSVLDRKTASKLTITLEKIQDLGVDLIPTTLTADELAQVAKLSFNPTTFTAELKGGAYTFRAVAYYIESIQSAESFLFSVTTIKFKANELILEATSQLRIGRAAGVVVTDVPDLQSFTIRKEGTEDAKQFINYQNGAILIKTSAPVVVNGGFSAADSAKLATINNVVVTPSIHLT